MLFNFMLLWSKQTFDGYRWRFKYFALVAAMLGLFGSQVIPSVVRLDSLNSFNYVTVISLFDVVSILDGTNAFIYKLVILFTLGIIGYFLGTKKFVRKDLPL